MCHNGSSYHNNKTAIFTNCLLYLLFQNTVIYLRTFFKLLWKAEKCQLCIGEHSGLCRIIRYFRKQYRKKNTICTYRFFPELNENRKHLKLKVVLINLIHLLRIMEKSNWAKLILWNNGGVSCFGQCQFPVVASHFLVCIIIIY